MLRLAGSVLAIVLVGIAATLVIGQIASSGVHNDRLESALTAVATDLRAEAVLLDQREGDFIGPGSNGVSLLVLALPQDTVERVERGGEVYLNQMQDQTFTGWRPTPVNAVDPEWTSRDDAFRGDSARIDAFFALNSFVPMPVDERWREEIDAILAAPGSYYAYRPHSIALVAPDKRLAIVAFAK